MHALAVRADDDVTLLTDGPGGVEPADAIEIDAQQRTTADGVLAAGDVSVPMPSVANAIAAGALAAAMVVHDLTLEPAR